MIDLTLLRNDPKKIEKALLKKDADFDVNTLIAQYRHIRALRVEVEELRFQKNKLADDAKSGVTEELRKRSSAVGRQLKVQEQALRESEQLFNDTYLQCPNLPDDDIPSGGKENNKVILEYGKKPTFSFAVQDHVQLGEKLGWLNFRAGAVLAGSQFVVYQGEAVQLIRALIRMMLEHNQSHGFVQIMPPALVNEQALFVAGNFPKFYDDVYSVRDEDLFLIPTSEVSLVNIYRDQIIQLDDLPIRMTAATSCFRREAGGYGKHERGLIRMHQFEKVELVSLCEPEQSGKELDNMVACAQELLEKLGIAYRTVLLAAGDCSFQAAKTYDIEVWLPSQNNYYEVSSCSSCSDFQARRGRIRYRPYQSSKTDFVHTLNASSLALPRLIVALMETYQQKDGLIVLPKVLKSYLS